MGGNMSQPRFNAPGHMQPREFHAANGGVVRTDLRGNPREVRASGYTVVRGPGESRRIVTERNGHVIVTDRTGRVGFAQSRFVVRGHEFAHRTYFVNGVRSERFYRPYHWGGGVYHVYAPVRFYRPAFYAYAYRPWPRAVEYRWGWYNDPWYAYYRPYFAPYPVYPGPAFWLTDYMIASSFQAAYQEQVSQQMAFTAGQAMNDQVKQAVSDEVQRQLEWEQQQSAQPQASNDSGQGTTLPIFDNAQHTLLVATNMNVVSDTGECPITQGDIIQFMGVPPSGQDSMQVRVLWSKGQDCAANSNITIPVEQVQELQNQMMANLDKGLEQIQNNQGKDGLPQVPSNLVGSTEADYAAQAPPPEPNIADELKQGATEGLRVEQATVQATSASFTQPQQNGLPAGGGTGTVNEGQSLDEVIANLGQPKTTATVGAKTILVYASGMKIILMNNRVTDVQ
jgi:hypothetical protein